MWPREDLQVLLGVDHPIIQAPMTGITTPELVSTVSNVGALGSLGCGVLPSDMVRDQVAAVRAGTNRAFNINFFAHPKPSFDRAVAAQAHESVQRYYDELGLGAVPEPSEPIETGRLRCLEFSDHGGRSALARGDRC